MVFANGAAVAKSTLNTVYYHDFQPGTYRFTVQAYGTPANLVDTVALSPGTETYLQVQAVPNWEMGSNRRGRRFCRADDVVRGRPAISSDDEVSRRALTHSDPR